MTNALRILLSLLLTVFALLAIRLLGMPIPVFNPLVFALVWLAVAAGIFISPLIRTRPASSSRRSRVKNADTGAHEDREQGQVKWFNISKGYGFITRSNGEDVFVHFRAINVEGRRGLREGEIVEFSLTQSEKGPQAEDVRLLGA